LSYASTACPSDVCNLATLRPVVLRVQVSPAHAERERIVRDQGGVKQLSG